MYVHYMCKDNSDIMYLHVADYECSTGCIFQSHTAEECLESLRPSKDTHLLARKGNTLDVHCEFKFGSMYCIATGPS